MLVKVFGEWIFLELCESYFDSNTSLLLVDVNETQLFFIYHFASPSGIRMRTIPLQLISSVLKLFLFLL